MSDIQENNPENQNTEPEKSEAAYDERAARFAFLAGIDLKELYSSMQARTPSAFQVGARVVLAAIIIFASIFLIQYHKEIHTRSWDELFSIATDDAANKTGLPAPASIRKPEGKNPAELIASPPNSAYTSSDRPGDSAPSSPIRPSTPSSNGNQLFLGGEESSLTAEPPNEPKDNFIEKPNVIFYLKKGLVLVRSGAEHVYIFKNLISGINGAGKTMATDRKTPLGQYRVIIRSYSAVDGMVLMLDYPNARDAESGLTNGTINVQDRNRLVEAENNATPPDSTTPLGGPIFIRAIRGNETYTDGDLAISTSDMKLLYEAIPVNTPIIIVDQ